MTYTNTSEENIKNWLKKNLNEKRFLHSVGTANCAKELAQRYGLNTEKAYIAGLLHDAAKCLPVEQLIQMVKQIPYALGEEINNPKTLHAPASAYVAENEFGVKDSEILSAIRWHTLGKTNMTPFEKIIFLADKVEPNTRNKDYSEKLTKLLDEENGLDKALLECYKITIISLVNRNLKICTKTIDIYNDLQSKISS